MIMIDRTAMRWSLAVSSAALVSAGLLSVAALAQAAPATGAAGSAPNMLMQLLPLALIFVVFYFLLIRPQQQRLKQHRDMIANLRRGDVVVTSGGIIGKVTRLGDAEATIEIAENVRVKVIRATITEVRAKTEPSPAPANDPADDETDDAKA